MELVLLEEQQHRFFDDNGYLVVPGALTEREVALLTAVCDRMIDEFGREADQYYGPAAAGDCARESVSPAADPFLDGALSGTVAVAQYPSAHHGDHL